MNLAILIGIAVELKLIISSYILGRPYALDGADKKQRTCWSVVVSVQSMTASRWRTYVTRKLFI